jgi:riboflavin synthase
VFTGIVEELGSVRSREGSRLVIDCSLVLDDVSMGASIAVNGCCLTVVDWGSADLDQACAKPSWWAADVTDESFARTNLGDLRPGDPVNLERPVRLADRLGGHLVQGHVDGVGTVTSPAPDLRVSLPDGLGRYVVEKGSITVDGVSLTVVAALDDAFSVAVIPHTQDVTTLGARQPGDRVNLEVDVTAKYVERLLNWKAG